MGSSINLNEIGQKLPDDAATFYRERVADLLNRRTKTFPGAQPVSFARSHFEALQATDYYLCEKTDGIRCLLLCDRFIEPDENPREIYFLIDRKNDYYAIKQGHFHLPASKDDISTYHPGTILDGELVRDRLSNGHTTLKYLIFDCLCLDADNITQRSLDIRLGKVQEFIWKPYEHFAKMYPGEIAVQPFDVELKRMEFPYAIEMMFREKLLNLKHGNDGLIFTCRTTHYVAGTDPHILKWKPPHENTIDFRLNLGEFPVEDDEEGSYTDYDAMPEMELWVNHGGSRERKDGYRRFANLSVAETEWEAMKGMGQMLDGRIIECFRDPDTAQWRPKIEEDGCPRFRDDKTDANHISTVNSVLDSIKDAVTEQDLVANAWKIRAAFKERQRQRDERKAQEKKRNEQAAQEKARAAAARADAVKADAAKLEAANANAAKARNARQPPTQSRPAAAQSAEHDDGPKYDD